AVCCTSSCSSVRNNSRRVWTIPSKLPEKRARDCSNPEAVERSSSRFEVIDRRAIGLGGSAPARQQAEQQPDAGGNAERLPGIFAYVTFGRLRHLLRALERLLLELVESRLSLPQRLLGAGAHLLDPLAGLGRRRFEQRFGVRDDRFQVGY